MPISWGRQARRAPYRQVHICTQIGRPFQNRAGVFGRLAPGDELLLFNAENVHGAYDADDKEGQLIRNVCRVLIEGFEHAAVGKCAERIQQAVDNGKRYCKPAFA